MRFPDAILLTRVGKFYEVSGGSTGDTELKDCSRTLGLLFFSQIY